MAASSNTEEQYGSNETNVCILIRVVNSYNFKEDYYKCNYKSRKFNISMMDDNLIVKKEENCKEEGEVSVPELSKNQRKKLEKKKKWLEKKSEKRLQERQKRKLRYATAREQGVTLGPSRKSLKRNGMAESSCRINIVIDCSFDDLMSEKDINNTVKQIQFSYAANRRALDPAQFYVTNLKGKCLTRLEQIGDYKGWDVNFTSESHDVLFSKDKVVYLTSDSSNIISTVEGDKAYIIGGLIDHNHHKGLCLTQAIEKGYQHGKLPIEEFLDLKTRKVLTINQVFEILLKFIQTSNWEQAFFEVIPKRKGAISRKSSDVSTVQCTETDISKDNENNSTENLL